MAHWVIHRERGGFPVERARLGACELCVVYVAGEWQWLVRCRGRDLAEGNAPSPMAAHRQAEAVALRLAAPALPQAA